jgi:hypothetical protein
MGSAPANSTITEAGAVYISRKYIILSRIATEAGEIPKANNTMKNTFFALIAV